MSPDSGKPACNQAMQRLHQYVDRELTEAEMTEVQLHLEDCPPCEKHFTVHASMKRLVHSKACPENAPQELLDRILSNLRTSR
ncbi:MAG: hypothetical protein QOE92_1284 [Chloroflexota bacterium]|jgi:mycothiol system anti-sigma-R factor|nr:hypothetical protein [Chloroflexota bacterium]